jgi:ribosomal protein S18 acetylase RimI-like enzyme
MKYRKGNINDLEQLKGLAIKAWGQFQSDLTTENWQKLHDNLNSDETYLGLLRKSYCLICENDEEEIIGMAFLVPKGNPTEIYDHEWCYIRLVSVHPDYGGRGIGRQLTEKCIEVAKNNKEQTIALHTSEIMNKARHIYESLGFKVFREIEPRLGKKY